LVSRQGRIIVKLPDEEAQRELLALEGAEPWRFGRRAPPRGWLQLPESFHDDPEALERWLRRARSLGRDTTSAPAKRKKRKASGK
jgi:TfoX/Sxy family transcriptional regulator of competence genes